MISNELQQYNDARNEATKGLVNCDVILYCLEIQKLGYTIADFQSANIGIDEHEFTVYRKDDKRMVFVQTYSDREGGLYFQSLFAEKETVNELEKHLVLASLNEPSSSLVETILHFKGIKIPGTERFFPDNSIYMGCHHYLTISHDPALAEQAISNYKKMNITSESQAERKIDERMALVLLALW